MPLIFSLEIKTTQAYHGQLCKRGFAIFFYSALLIGSGHSLYDNASILWFGSCFQRLDLCYHDNYAWAALSTIRPWPRVDSLPWHGVRGHFRWQKPAFEVAARAKNHHNTHSTESQEYKGLKTQIWGICCPIFILSREGRCWKACLRLREVRNSLSWRSKGKFINWE